MTSLVPRKPYTDEELRKLYPTGLELRQVQVLMRHGERTPVSARFQNAGLNPFWPYCSVARHMKSAVLTKGFDGSQPADLLEWKRRLETFGDNDAPVVATGPEGEIDGVCDMGSLTDKGRQSTYSLGQRLRNLYVDRLGFLPSTLSSTDSFYLRSTPVPRALESLEQAFSALYPPSTRKIGPDGKLANPTIFIRGPQDEILYPNEGSCRRFAALARAFAQRAAERWNNTPEMEYLNKIYGKWMPAGTKVAVDSRPRLSGIMDTVNSTLAHGPATRLPDEFYDERARKIMEKIAVDEWFSGFKESKEYRAVGMGALAADIVQRMIENVEAEHDGKQAIRFGLSGCHDTSLAGILASLGAFNTTEWPPFTSHVAIELFRKKSNGLSPSQLSVQQQSRWSKLFQLASATGAGGNTIGRKPISDLTQAEKDKLNGYYVRIRYNDEPVTVPACRLPGNHLEGDESFCTLVSI